MKKSKSQNNQIAFQFDNYTARKCWNKLAQRLREEGSEVVTNCHRLKLLAFDGKMREIDCADTEGMYS